MGGGAVKMAQGVTATVKQRAEPKKASKRNANA